MDISFWKYIIFPIIIILVAVSNNGLENNVDKVLYAIILGTILMIAYDMFNNNRGYENLDNISRFQDIPEEVLQHIPKMPDHIPDFVNSVKGVQDINFVQPQQDIDIHLQDLRRSIKGVQDINENIRIRDIDFPVGAVGSIGSGLNIGAGNVGNIGSGLNIGAGAGTAGNVGTAGVIGTAGTAGGALNIGANAGANVGANLGSNDLQGIPDSIIQNQGIPVDLIPEQNIDNIDNPDYVDDDDTVDREHCDPVPIMPAPYTVTYREEDLAKTGMVSNYNHPNYPLLQRGQFNKRHIPFNEVLRVIDEQRYNHPSHYHQKPGYTLLNNDMFTKRRVSYRSAPRIIKDSKFNDLYNQHNHNICWSPHTHVGKSRGYINWERSNKY